MSSASVQAKHVHSSIGYRPEIDGLRAIAVLSVILFHAELIRLPGGFFGVDVFFVISGYLITKIILADLEGGGAFQHCALLRKANPPDHSRALPGYWRLFDHCLWRFTTRRLDRLFKKSGGGPCFCLEHRLLETERIF